MIKNIIFDFGDVFINLDKMVVTRELSRLSDPEVLVRLKALNDAYETGNITSKDFIEGLQEALPGRNSEQIKALWNSMLLDFPEHRLLFLEKLAHSAKYRLFLLSNTNELHILRVAEIMGASKFKRFRDSFEGFYLSHEIRMRKPDPGIFRFVLEEQQLHSQETLFIDDGAENIDAARKLGIKTWQLQVGTEDITSLASKL
jgi:putative hydrolase of the HAD superfamily